MIKSMPTAIRSAVLIALLIFVPVAFCLAGPQAQSNDSPSTPETRASLDQAPKAAFPQPKYEFAPIYEGTDVKHDFVVENTGEAPLVIKSIRPD